jgi:hypothetical protein
MAIFRVERNGQPRYPMGGNTASEPIRRVHEHRHVPQPTAHADYESLAHPLYGVSSKHGIDLFRSIGRDAASRGIVNGSGQVPMDRSGRSALRP